MMYFSMKVRSPGGSDSKVRVFDAQHERRRKEQLEKLFHRTEEQVGIFCLVLLHIMHCLFSVSPGTVLSVRLPQFLNINIKHKNMSYEYL